MISDKIINNLHLQQNEEIISVIRKSLFAWFWWIFLAVFLLILPFFLIYPLFQFGLWGVVIFALLIIFSLAVFLRIYLDYYGTLFIMTSMRVIDIDHKGFFGEEMSEAGYAKIEEVYFKSSGMIKKILGLNDLFISFSGNQHSQWRLSHIKSARETAAKILSQQEKYLSLKLEERNLEAEYLLDKIRKKLGPEAFAELIAD